MPDLKHKRHEPDGGATDQVGVGPTGIDGAEASELPNGGRDNPDTNIGHEMARKLPGQTGGIVGDGTDVGIAAEPDVADARDHGGRKHN